MILRLKNPRSSITSATITSMLTPAGDRTIWWLSVTDKFGGHHSDWSPSLTAAKRLFSTNVLDTKHWGKNEWEEAKEIQHGQEGQKSQQTY
jgi:hypothetical protein